MIAGPEPLAWQLMMLLASGWHLTPEMLRAKHDTKVVLRVQHVDDVEGNSSSIQIIQTKFCRLASQGPSRFETIIIILWPRILWNFIIYSLYTSENWIVG